MTGVPLAAVARFAGHRSISMTMRYAHLQKTNDGQAVSAMMSFYPSQEGNQTATRTATGTPDGFAQVTKLL